MQKPDIKTVYEIIGDLNKLNEISKFTYVYYYICFYPTAYMSSRIFESFKFSSK